MYKWGNSVLLYLCIILYNCKNGEWGRAMKWHLAPPTACSHSWWPCPESSWTDRLFLKTSPKGMLVTSGAKSSHYLTVFTVIWSHSLLLFFLVLILLETENSWLCSLNNLSRVMRQFWNHLPAFGSGPMQDSGPSICASNGPTSDLSSLTLRALQPSQISLTQGTWSMKEL